MWIKGVAMKKRNCLANKNGVKVSKWRFCKKRWSWPLQERQRSVLACKKLLRVWPWTVEWATKKWKSVWPLTWCGHARYYSYNSWGNTCILLRISINTTHLLKGHVCLREVALYSCENPPEFKQGANQQLSSSSSAEQTNPGVSYSITHAHNTRVGFMRIIICAHAYSCSSSISVCLLSSVILEPIWKLF